MIVLVCGGRDYMGVTTMHGVLGSIHSENGIDLLIQGGASGADRIAKSWAIDNGVHYAEVPALWNFYGKSAGPKRNLAMAQMKPDLCVAFRGGSGTNSMVKVCQGLGIPVRKIT